MDAYEAVIEMSSEGLQADLEAVFRLHYGRVARMIGSVIHDRGRAEELAVEVFLDWARSRAAQSPHPEGWLYRAAAHMAVDELRRQTRRKRYDHLTAWMRRPPTPEEVYGSKQEQDNVRAVLSGMLPKQAELLILRAQGLSYGELASALGLNQASLGTLLGRAQLAFRKEYIKKYGQA